MTAKATASALLLAGAVAACAADSPIAEHLMVMPGYYDTLECQELSRQVQSASTSIKELTKLMERSGKGTGGTIVNALAYDTDYAKARATLRYATEAAERKGCDLSAKSNVNPPEKNKPDRAGLNRSNSPH